MDVRMTSAVLVLWFLLIVFGSGDPMKTPKKHFRAVEVLQNLLRGYNRHEPPMLDKPTEVQIGVYISSFNSINEQTMDYSVSMYLRQAWHDPRLNFTNTSFKRIRVAENNWKKIWTPDTYFRNEKHALFHRVPVENRHLVLNSTGGVWYVTKISAVFPCAMHLQRYPLDTQICPMMFESFGHTMDTLYFSWLETPVDIGVEATELQLSEFNLVGTNLIDCFQNYTTGAYPCLEIRFILQRNIGYFLIQVYVPSILIVILSWVSFWINVDASPARISIGLLTVLTMTTMSGAARATLPKVSYIKAIDVWMSICLLFVFMSLIEYAIVNVLVRRPASTTTAPRRMLSFRRSASKDKDRRQGPEDVAPTAATNHTGHEQPTTMANNLRSRDEESGRPTEVRDGKFQARRVDDFSRRFFPLSFILFNVVYWTVYTIPYGHAPKVVA